LGHEGFLSGRENEIHYKGHEGEGKSEGIGGEIVILIGVATAEGVVHIGKRVTGTDDTILGGKVPFELVEFGDEGIGEDEVIVDEFALGATRALGDAPAEGLLRAGEDLVNATAVLKTDIVGVDMVAEAAGLDDGEEAPAYFGFLRLGELDGDDTGGEGTVEERPEAFAHTGGVDDDVLGVPGLGKAFEFAEYGKVTFADPTVAGDDVVGGAAEGLEGGEVDLEDGEGGGITAGVAEAGSLEGVEAGFVHAGDVEEEGGRPFDAAQRVCGAQPYPQPLPRWKSTIWGGERPHPFDCAQPYPRPLPKSFGFREGSNDQ
jgi:hypothetical protein